MTAAPATPTAEPAVEVTPPTDSGTPTPREGWLGAGPPATIRGTGAPVAPSPSTAADAEAPARAPRLHPVDRGESLWRITADLLGGSATDTEIAAAWPALYAANRDTIGEDPNLIRVGQLLTVPAALDGPRS